MKLPEGLVEKLVSTEVTRYILTHVMYEVEKSRVMASNGRVAVILPVVPDEGDITGPIHPRHFKEARKRGKKLTEPSMKTTATITYPDGSTDPNRADEQDWSGQNLANYPLIDAVVPERKGQIVSLNAHLLKDLADALQDPKGMNPGFIRLFIPEKKGDPIRVEAWQGKGVDNVDGKVGVLMPLIDR